MSAIQRKMRKLRLLMWKHFHLRKNRWILSLIELLLPILIIWVISKSAASFISPGKMEHINATIPPPVSAKSIVQSNHSFNCIVYTPKRPILVDLMNQYLEYIKSVQLTDIPLKIDGVEDEVALEQFLSQDFLLEMDNLSCIGIVFKEFSAVTDVNGNGVFSYTFRSTEDLITDEVYYVDEGSTLVEGGPLGEDSYIQKGFAAVQLALNEAFLKYKNKTAAYDMITLQSFPYPEYMKENEFRSAIPTVISNIVLMTAMILSVTLITTIIEEKTSGLKELMKIVGMEEWLIWLGWFLHALIFSLITYTIVTYLLQHEFSGPESAIIRNVNPFILLLHILLYYIANIAFCFMFAALFHQATVATSMYVLTLALLIYGNSYLQKMKFVNLRKIACLIPSAAFDLGFERIKFTEVHDVYLGWHNLFSPGSSTLSLGFAFIMMIIDTFLYMFLAYYISAINPGKFGVRKSPFFILHPLISSLKKKESRELVNLEDPIADRFIEKPPSDLEVTIKIKDLHKNFGPVYAVKGVNLNVYKGEITALLGHNGAGKTTTLAILTGIVKPTAGSIVYKEKLDVLNQPDEFRHHLGMCPQEDRLFPYLTVVEHLLFFGQLKGASKRDALNEAREYMKLMEIEDKSNSLVSSLSGGMKRKLCLSIALMGKAETLILDEPTSGLDVESRRKLWDLLLRMRGSRTIILTTHHMEEADALGDRIAIMHHGTIVCHGTSLFLKKSYNTGYQVTITKSKDIDEKQLSNLIQSSGVVDVSLESSTVREVVYKLPLTETAKFSRLFKDLEDSKNQLGIVSIGVSCTTMEQVFLKVGGVSRQDPLDHSRNGSALTNSGTVNKHKYLKKSGPSLILQQLYALSRKKFLYILRNWINLFFRVIFPSLMLIILVHGTKKFDHSEKSLQIDYTLYRNTKVMVQDMSDSSPMWKRFQTLLEPYGVELIASQGDNIVEGLLKYAREDLGSFKHGVILAMEKGTGDDRNITLLYNEFALHSLPLGLNVFVSNLMRYRDNASTEFVMTSHPIRKSTETCALIDPDMFNMVIIWFIVLAFYTIDLNTYFMTAINVERQDGFKHIQLMSSVSPITYWLSHFVFDYIFFFSIVLLRIITLKLLNDDDFLKIDHHFFMLILALALFIASCLPFTYVLSYLSNSKDGSYLLVFIVNILSAFAVTGIYFADQVLEKQDLGFFWDTLYRVVKYLVLLFPPMNYSLIFFKLFFTWYSHKHCLDCKQYSLIPCPDMSYLVFRSDSQPDGILREVLFLVFDVLLYTVLLGLIQYGYFEVLLNKILIKIYGSSVSSRKSLSEEGDSDVQLEKAKVHRLASLSSGTSSTSENVLISHELRKNFVKLFRPFTAVASVNFTVKAGECFGLLGVNGAGKSTTFRMLTGDLLPTKGNSSIMGCTLKSNRTEYLSKAGYCAQSNCFLEELSGRETLLLVASLRGIRSNQLENVVDKWLNILGLTEYQNQLCGSYSGGNKRKLCTAMSLIGDPAVVFLDEPTSGVDPVARRRLYTVMKQSRESGQAVVLTSHSMEECENLCDRLTILVKGRMQCIGTAQHLKQTYAQGFSILIKISDVATNEALFTLKQQISDEFNKQSVLKDERRTQLYYQITTVDMLWSTLFAKMERLKESNKNVIEDYSLSDTSLEEVFISFAKNSHLD